MLIIAHAPSGNTQRLRDALAKGAQSQLDDAHSLVVKNPFDTHAADVLAASGVILFTPENFGYMSGAMKDFFDRCFYDLIDQTDAMPYALVIRAGKDGTGTQRAVEGICAGMSWKPAQPALICRGAFQAGFISQCGEVGASLAAGLSLGMF